jgi:putative membrane protein
MMNNWGYGIGMSGGTGSWIFSFLLMAGIIVGIIFFIKWIIQNTQNNGLSKKESSALEILKARYANGEISREEYLEIKSIIEDKNNL